MFASVPAWGPEGNYDTSYYTITGNTIRTIRLNFRDTVYIDIQKLTANQLTIYRKQNHPAATTELWQTATR